MNPVIDSLAAEIRDAAARGEPLRIRGGGTKDFYGGPLDERVLDACVYAGIVDYEPTELVLTARAGTPIASIEATLSERGQMLAFEPPRFGPGSTFGGVIAAGLSGPRRPYAGSVRDHVLGVRLLDGRGDDLRFGGQVMKNVAGYDVSRLVTGSLGTLGLVLEASVKVLPRPPLELTLVQTATAAEAIDRMNAWAGKPHPITGTCHVDSVLYLRLSGAESAVRAAEARIGGERCEDAGVWDALRDGRHTFLDGNAPVWRLSVRPTAPADALPNGLIEWGGALRWIRGDADSKVLRETARQMGGHATLFRGGDKQAGVFQPLSPALLGLHRRLRASFDPHGVFSARRLHSNL